MDLSPFLRPLFFAVFIQAFRKQLPWRVALPIGINLVANLIFTPIQFGMRDLTLAVVDIIVVWATMLWMVVAVRRYCRWVAVAQIP